jgi:hypothetical protein
VFRRRKNANSISPTAEEDIQSNRRLVRFLNNDKNKSEHHPKQIIIKYNGREY